MKAWKYYYTSDVGGRVEVATRNDSPGIAITVIRPGDEDGEHAEIQVTIDEASVLRGLISQLLFMRQREGREG